MSVLLAFSAWALFVLLWVTTWLHWFQHIGIRGIPSDLVVGATYFAVCPGLAALSILFSVRDATRKSLRRQAVSACLASGGLLLWFWLNPPR